MINFLLGNRVEPAKWEILCINLDEEEVSRTLEHCIIMNDYMVCLLGNDFYTRFKTEVVK